MGLKSKLLMTALGFAGLMAGPASEGDPFILRNYDRHMFGGMRNRNTGSIYTPRHGKFKGYMRDNRNWGRKRKAA